MGLIKTNANRETRAVRVPVSVLSFMNRVMALPPGIHTITLVKAERGADGIVGWSVMEGGRLEGVRLEGNNEGHGEETKKAPVG